MKPFLNKFLNIFHFRRQTAFFAVFGAVFVLGILIFPYHSAHAGVVSGMVGEALSWIFSLIFAVLGWVLTSLIGALVSIAEYNKIITQPTIINTWGVVRDIVNMFFIFAMLLIAFSTILRYQQYEAKKLLPKLVLYAVLVNFSLTICGLFIDIAQVFTLTFVNAFKDGAINNFTTVTKLFDYSSIKDTKIDLFTVMGGYMLALVLLVVTLVTIGAMFLILLVRIAYLWILSILSPFAFVLPIIPGGQSYASQWWTMFSKQVITGPLLAFFIWLSLSILSQTGNIGNEILNSSGTSTIGGAIGSGVAQPTVTGLPTTQADFLINYVIAIAMMFIGLMLTSQMGGAAGKIAGAASSKMQSYGTTAAKWTGRRVGVWGAVGAATGGIGLVGGAAAGMAARYTTRRLAQSDRGQRFLQNVARIPIIGQATSVGLRGLRQQRLKVEEKAQKKLRRSTPGELGYYANMMTFTEEGRELRSQARDKAPSQIRNQNNMINHLQGMDEKELSGLSTNELMRLGDRGVTRAHLDMSDNYRALSVNKRDAMEYAMTGRARPLNQEHQYRYFTEIGSESESGETEASPNDITSGDMVVRANQVNVTGDKAGSTLGKDLGNPAKTSGVDSLLRRGSKDGVGRLAIDFNRLGLTGAGANLVGEGKAQMIPKLMDQLRKEGRTPAELQSIEQELQKAKSLSLINKTRDKGDARKIISHEAIHDVLDDGVSVEERRDMWGKMDPQKQAETEKKIRTNWVGGDKMSQDQVIEEYLANGLTNETRWGDKSPNALKLDKSVQDELRKKGVFKKMNEGLVHRMSENDIKTPDALKTEEEFRKHNEQVAAQVSGQAIHQTLTGKAQEESGEKAAQEEEFEITGEGELEGKEEKAEEEEEEKKEEKTATEHSASKAPEASYRESDTQETQVQSVIKHMDASDARFFKSMFGELGKTIGQTVGRLGSVVVGSQAGQGKKMAERLGELYKASEHIESKNPLEQKASRDEFDIKVKEIIKEYDIITEAPSAEQGTSQEDIKKAINDMSNKS